MVFLIWSAVNPVRKTAHESSDTSSLPPEGLASQLSASLTDLVLDITIRGCYDADLAQTVRASRARPRTCSMSPHAYPGRWDRSAFPARLHASTSMIDTHFDHACLADQWPARGWYIQEYPSDPAEKHPVFKRDTTLAPGEHPPSTE
jgi:hypothetical protein